MKRGLLVFLAICAFASAMVPRDRRAVNTEEDKEIENGDKRVCQSQTICAWAVYKSKDVKIIELHMTNNYCSCGAGTSCVQDEDDQYGNAYLYRCREPKHDETEDN